MFLFCGHLQGLHRQSQPPWSQSGPSPPCHKSPTPGTVFIEVPTEIYFFKRRILLPIFVFAFISVFVFVFLGTWSSCLPIPARNAEVESGLLLLWLPRPLDMQESFLGDTDTICKTCWTLYCCLFVCLFFRSCHR